MSATSQRHVDRVATAALGAVPVVALGMADGGFYPRPWGWATMGLALTVVVAACVRRTINVSRNVLLLLALLAALGIWTAASLTWTRSVGATMFELERLLVYAAALGAAAVLVRPATSRALVAGVFLGTSALTIWGLVAYLLAREGAPDPLQGWYLHRPVGYANGMAITAAVAILLGLGFARDARPRPARTLAAGALVPLTAALALTGSRAAWAALVVGLIAFVAVTPDRAQLVASLPLLVIPAAAGILAVASDVTDTGLVGDDGRALANRLLLAVGLLTVAAFVVERLALHRFVRVPRRTATVALVLGASVGVILAATNAHLLAGDRTAYWRAAAAELREHPLLGSGAGSFGQIWLERRSKPISVRDAHSLPIETAAELGVVGLALVCVLFAAPLVWSLRARRSAHVPTVAGAFTAFATHTAVDWDWELPAVAIAGLFCAVALGVSADSGSRTVLSPLQRGAVVGLGAGAVALGLVGFVGASALEDANRALARGDHTAAEREAERAEHWQPWAVEPALIRGRSLLALGDRGNARDTFIRAAAREPNDYRVWLALAAVSDGDAVPAALARARGLNRFAVAQP